VRCGIHQRKKIIVRYNEDEGRYDAYFLSSAFFITDDLLQDSSVDIEILLDLRKESILKELDRWYAHLTSTIKEDMKNVK
jgi:hypothetical protein